MKQMFSDVVAFIMYTDGGLDLSCKHKSAWFGISALFLELGLDTLVVMRTAPTQNLGNHAERVMPVLNLGLQGVALAREVLPDDEMETAFKRCNGMSGARKAAETYSTTAVGPHVVAEENVEQEPHPQQQQQHLQHQLLMQQQQHNCDEELLSLLREEIQYSYEEDEQLMRDEEHMQEVLRDANQQEHHHRHNRAFEVDMTG
jgi:hypothetical protein